MCNSLVCLSSAARENICSLLLEHGRSRRWLARALGTNDVWVGRRLNGKTKFSLDDLGRIAEVFGLTPAHLLSDAACERDARDPRLDGKHS
jgi:hypothetical protein